MQDFHSDLQVGALKKKMYDFLDFHSLLVLSTVGEGEIPESAILEYVVEEDLSIYFATSRDSRKARNLLHHNTNIAAVIGFYEEKTMQYEGQAQLVPEKALPEQLKERLMTRGKRSHKPSEGEFMYFKVNPRFVRLTDVSVSPWNIEEVRLSTD